MSTYACKTQNCTGILVFRDPPAKPTESDSGFGRERADLTLVDERPEQCSECRVSYYRYELE